MAKSNMAKPMERSTIVIGGGVAGTAIAWGLARRGAEVLVLDQGDDAYRAARGNFGLIWVQGKGANCPPYAAWTRRSALAWPAFAKDLQDETGIDLQFSQRGGLHLALCEAELEAAAKEIRAIAQASSEPLPFKVLDREDVRAILPEAGPDVFGAVFCPLDGQVSPLRLLRALFAALAGRGARVLAGAEVQFIHPAADGFDLETPRGRFHADRIVLAAGLGNRVLAPMLGLSAPVEPQRGQVLITERLPPFLPLPTMQVRQTAEGTVQIGDTREWAGFDDGVTHAALARLAQRAVKSFPRLASAQIVRAWGALRVMTPDGLPIYQRSARYPKASLVTCHSGITLAANHAGPICDWILDGVEPEEILDFKVERFDVSAA